MTIDVHQSDDEKSTDTIWEVAEKALAVPEERSKRRIYFLDALRAIAVLLVLWGHVFLVGINDPATVSTWVPDVKGFLFGPNTIADNIHGQLGLVVALATGVNPGGLGVAIFFLVSGFVILRTIDRSSPEKFLVHRFFRIIPTCAVAVLLVSFLTFLYCEIKHIPQPNSIKGMITSTFALNYYNGSFQTIPVLWTLEIEMFFYILISIIAKCTGRLSIEVIFTVSMMLVAFDACMASPLATRLGPTTHFVFSHISTIFISLNYMFIGSFIYRVYSGESSRKDYIYGVMIASLYVLSACIYETSTGHSTPGMNTPDTVTALVIFLLTLWAGMRSWWLAPLRWIGDISYSLYLVHIPIGWGILAFLGRHGWRMNSAAVTTTVCVIFLAWLMHKYVEIPSQQLGKRIA